MPPEDWPNTGLLFWVYVTTVPLTFLAFANLIAACFRSKRKTQMVAESSFHRSIREAYDLPLLHTGNDQSHQVGFTAGRDRCNIISMAFLQSWTSSSYIGRMVDGAQSILYTDNHRG
jgi:hypothetical protein